MEGGCEVKRRLVSSQMLPSDCPDTLVSRPKVLKAAAFKVQPNGATRGKGEGGITHVWQWELLHGQWQEKRNGRGIEA
jgi:hypothetical protein